MKATDIRKIRKAMEKSQDEKRFEHTLGVTYTATALAMRYGASMENAELAGLLHDCAKCMDDNRKISICEKHHISMTELERRNPYLLHAKVGSFLAMDTYKVHNPDIINAILNHTTGRPGMSLLEKIIFVADYIEPHRKQAPSLAEIRKLAFEDLDEAMIRILEDTLGYLDTSEAETDPMTKKTYTYYMAEKQEREQKKGSGEL
ncbi:MAG: bis(5'-nucleosyl)-tetraphosphatase (symmetrical) YqeK [Lachnospiraceae bacterium]|nr:bis(5'-nucleosyl)-tetraphosphatase (symmetrical) YqeK [Lachnospiraceae bacterium]